MRSWRDLRWKVRNEIGNNEVGKLRPKLESKTIFRQQLLKLERTIEVGKVNKSLKIQYKLIRLCGKKLNGFRIIIDGKVNDHVKYAQVEFREFWDF